MSDGNTFNINTTVSGGAQQQNIGQQGGEAKMEVIQEGGSVTLEQVLGEVVAAIPAESRESVEAEVIKPLRELAAKELPESEEEKANFRHRIWELAGKLEPYVPYIRKTLAAFAEGALKTIPPPASWVVGGVMEVVKDHRRD